MSLVVLLQVIRDMKKRGELKNIVSNQDGGGNKNDTQRNEQTNGTTGALSIKGQITSHKTVNRAI